MKSSMIRTPTQETSREVAKSSENISSKVTRADENQNWRNRNRVRFNDVGFDEGAIPENPFMNIRDVSELPMKGTTTASEKLPMAMAKFYKSQVP